MNVGCTLTHVAVALEPPMYLRLTSWRVMFWQGIPLLHLRLTATGDIDVPLMFLNLTSLIFTRDGACWVIVDENDWIFLNYS